MDTSNCTAIILAAGKGTRMRSQLPKVLHKVLDLPLIFYPLRLMEALKIGKIVVVLGHGGEMVEEVIRDFPVDVAWQHEQLGTGHAVACALDSVGGQQPHCLIMCGDMPLFTKNSISSFLEHHLYASNDITVLSAVFDNPTGYGRIVRGGGESLEAIIEEKDASPDIRAIKEVNTGTYVVRTLVLARLLEKIGNDNAQGEYYLTDIVHLAKDEALKVGAYTLAEQEEALGVNSRQDLARAEGVMLRRLREKHMERGVTLVMPHTIYIGNEVIIENDVVIEPFCVIKGRTIIRRGARIGAHSIVEGCVIAEGTTVPPFARLLG